MSTTRRVFLKTGIAGACVLVTARMLDRDVFAQDDKRGSLDLKKLANKDAACIAALAAAVLKGALPDEATAR